MRMDGMPDRRKAPGKSMLGARRMSDNEEIEHLVERAGRLGVRACPLVERTTMGPAPAAKRLLGDRIGLRHRPSQHPSSEQHGGVDHGSGMRSYSPPKLACPAYRNDV